MCLRRVPGDMVLRLTIFVIATCILGALQRGPAQPTVAMKADVDRLVARAEKLERLWPWQSPIPEVDRVVRHGRRVAPLLVELLVDDPDNQAPEAPAWTVQQQAALALCRIYGVSDACGRVYCNRATQDVNRGVKKFWRSKISEDVVPERVPPVPEAGSPEDRHAPLDWMASLR